MSEIIISLPSLHEGQKKIHKGLNRFNVINCGRRFGKTQYGFERLINPALDGYPVAWFAPSYRTMKEVWDKTIDLMAPVISHKDTQSKAVSLITGGKIEFWSLDNPRMVRGRKYKHIVIDEAAHVKDLSSTWGKVLRPLLTDFQGSADFLSTPNGKHNFFYTIFQRGGTDNWASFQMPTAANPYILQEEIDAAEQELDRLTFAQEYLAEFVDFVGMPFAYAFNPEKHIKETKYDPSKNILLTFDFGVDPMPCVALQIDHYPNKVSIIKEFFMYDGDVYRILTNIKAWLSSLPGNPTIKVTGDPSGRARSPLSEGAANAYRIIMDNLQVRKEFIQVPKKFSIKNSRALVNSVIEHVPFFVDPSCVGVIKDLKHVEVEADSFGAIKLKKTGKNEHAGTSNEYLTHFLDSVRYALHLEFFDFSAKLRK